MKGLFIFVVAMVGLVGAISLMASLANACVWLWRRQNLGGVLMGTGFILLCLSWPAEGMADTALVVGGVAVALAGLIIFWIETGPIGQDICNQRECEEAYAPLKTIIPIYIHNGRVYDGVKETAQGTRRLGERIL